MFVYTRCLVCLSVTYALSYIYVSKYQTCRLFSVNALFYDHVNMISTVRVHTMYIVCVLLHLSVSMCALLLHMFAGICALLYICGNGCTCIMHCCTSML